MLVQHIGAVFTATAAARPVCSGGNRGSRVITNARVQPRIRGLKNFLRNEPPSLPGRVFIHSYIFLRSQRHV